MVLYIPKDIELILDELKNEPDRAAALIGASMLEHALQEAIRSVLRSFHAEKDKDTLERLFGGHGIFSGLSAKILSAFALRIIGPVAQRDLDLINKIRNEFAHDMNPLYFNTPRVQDRCKELKITEDTLVRDNSRGCYLLAVQFYSAALNLWAIRELLDDADRLEMLGTLSG
jgi:DNA-binding MltR family transcriptional regulator